MIFHLGSKFGHDGPIPSMRLKALRRGLKDFEYLRLIEKSAKKTRQQLIKLADELLLGNKVDYRKLRQILCETLSGDRK